MLLCDVNCASMSSKIPKCRVPNNLLLPQKKKLVLQAVADGGMKLDIARHFEIPPSTLSIILKKKDEIMASSSSDLGYGREQGNFQYWRRAWSFQCQQGNIPVRGIILWEKTSSYASTLGITNIRVSDGWFVRFKKKINITFKKECREKASVDLMFQWWWMRLVF